MNYEKMAPELVSLCEDYRAQGRACLNSYADRIAVTHADRPNKAPGVAVFIRCDWEGDLAELAQQGIRVNQPSGKIRTAYLPIDAVEALAADNRIHEIVPATQLKLCMDKAGPEVKVPQFRAAKNVSGRGVVVGIVDTGIDPNHPAFRGRIHSIWDQSVPGPGVREAAFGLEVRGEAITASRDTDGHGTHVAGIAASADARFQGVAPEATLVIVKLGRFADAHIADGVRYIFRIAQELGLPAVANLSLGGHGDAHDGSDLFCRSLDEMTGPGRIICAAAGNEGEERIHSQVTLRRSETKSVSFTVNPGVRDLRLNCWYAGADRMEVSIRDPRGNATSFQGPITNGVPRRQTNLRNTAVSVTTPGPSPENGDNTIQVALVGAGNTGVVEPGTWRVSFRAVSVGTGPNAGRLDAWITNERAGSFANNVSDTMKIGSPGAAAQVITVGSFTTKREFTNRAGDLLEAPGRVVNDISPFSSEGPLRNGALKPDVAAPGALIVSALASDMRDVEESDVVADGFIINQGTSMACPFVAGLVALMLQTNAKLDPAQVKTMLRSASSVPNAAAGTHDIRWGFGRVDAAKLAAASSAAA